MRTEIYRNDKAIKYLADKIEAEYFPFVLISCEESVKYILPLCLNDLDTVGGYWWNGIEREKNVYATDTLADDLWAYSEEQLNKVLG